VILAQKINPQFAGLHSCQAPPKNTGVNPFGGLGSFVNCDLSGNQLVEKFYQAV
jgi:hypothetical protein